MRRLFLWSALLTVTLIVGQTLALAAGTDDLGGEDLTHVLVLFLHQLLLVYWLGPDIAVFIWSRRAANAELDVEQRVTAGQMMTMIDIVPRICLSLFLTVAGLLSDTYGIEHPWWQMAGIVLLGPVWLTIVILTYLNQGSAFGATLARLDIWLRIALVIGIPVSVGWSVMTGRLEDTPWIAGKLMLLALVILFGLIMRLKFRDFFAGLERLEREGQSPDVDTAIAGSLRVARPFGHGVWLLLLVASLMGVVKPGDRSPEPLASELSATVQASYRD